MVKCRQCGWRAAIAANVLISPGAMNSLSPEEDSLHALTGVARTVAISGSQSDTRRASLKIQYNTLGSRSTPELTFFNGVSGASLEAVPTPPEGELWFQDRRSGLQVRLWDWTEEGLGGAGMDLPTVARITACACSHILAARDALMDGAFPTLIVEDDVSFKPLLGQPGGRNAVARALKCADRMSRGQWGLLQLGYLLPSAHVAVQGLRSLQGPTGKVTRVREACSADFHIVGIQAYALSRRGAEAIASKYVSTVNLDNTRTSPSGSLSHLTIDLRSAVNLAADYALFNALPPHVLALLSWRPWILEEPILAAKSALFPGTVKSSTAITKALTTSILDGDKSSALASDECAPISESSPNSGSGPIAHWLFTGNELINVSSVHSSADLKNLLGVREGTVAAHVFNQCFDVCAPLLKHKDGHGDGHKFATTTLLMPSAMQCWRIQAPLSHEVLTGERGDLALCADWGADAGTCETLLRAVAAARIAHATVGSSGSKKSISLEHSSPSEGKSFDATPFETIAALLPWNASAVAAAYDELGNYDTAKALRGEHQRGEVLSSQNHECLHNQPPRSMSVLRLRSELQIPPAVPT